MPQFPLVLCRLFANLVCRLGDSINNYTTYRREIDRQILLLINIKGLLNEKDLCFIATNSML